MKCDELKDYDYDPDFPFKSRGRFYDADDVEAAIDELKAEHHKERHEYIEMVAQLKAENEKLKDELDAANNQCENLINSATDIMLRQDKVNDAKCDEVESLKATHYAEMVDAGMEIRRLKRALYKACANWAFLAQWERGELVENWEKWENVERKCGSKAQEYK